MKRIHLKTWLVAMAMMLTPCGAFAQYVLIDGVYYGIDGKIALVTSDSDNPNLYSGHVTIASEITYKGTTYPVTKIGFGAFWGSAVTSVTIPQGVTTIATFAFYKCSKLTSVSIPMSVTTIGENAFSDCPNLTSINIPAGVTKIERGTFTNDSSLVSVSLPEGLTAISDYAFQHCVALTSVNIPKTVTEIQSYAFHDCPGITSITLPEGLRTLSQGAFEANNLSRVVMECLPDSLSSHFRAFQESTAQTKLYVPFGTKEAYETKLNPSNFTGGVEELPYVVINDMAYIPDTDNKKMTLTRRSFNVRYKGIKEVPAKVNFRGDEYNVTAIGSRAFDSCEELLEAHIAQGITEIGFRAFSGCSRLTWAELPSTITSVGGQAFNSCSRLTKVVSRATTPPTLSDNAFLNIAAGCVLYVPAGKRDAYIQAGWTEDIFGGGVVEMGTTVDGIKYTIDPVKGTASVAVNSGVSGDIVIPATIEVNGINYKVTSLATQAFSRCTGLTSIVLPEGMTSIGVRAFGACTSLQKVTLPETLETILPGAFLQCTSLTSVTLPASLTTLNVQAFATCTALSSIVCNAQTPPTLQQNVFNGIPENCSLHVPAGTAQAYAESDWGTYFSQISDVIMGDANSDGKVSITDVGLMIDKILGNSPSGFNAAASDVNGDDNVTITDVGIVIDIILKQ